MIPATPGRSGALTLPHSVTLSSGSIVSVRVSDVLPDGRIRITLAGQTVTAEFAGSGARPRVGQAARALVQGTDGHGRVVIELLGNTDSVLLRRLDLPDDSAHRTAIEAFARSGLPLEPGALKETARLIRTEGNDASFFARIAAILRRKRLPAALARSVARPDRAWRSPEPMSAAGERGVQRTEQYSAEDGATGGDRRHTDEDGNQPDEHRQQPNRSRAGQELSRRERRELAEHLRERVERKTGTVHPIHLFNHISDGQGGWVIIPLSVSPFDSVSLALERDANGTTQRAALRIAFDDVRVQALWRPHGGNLSLSTNTPAIAHRMERLLSSLATVLESYGLHVDRVNTVTGIDGFSDESLENILQSIDTDV